VSTLLERSGISDEEFSLRMSKAAQTMLDTMRYPPGSVRKYALASGGEVIETSAKRMQEHLASLIDNLRLRYTLGYRPAITQPKGKFSAIKVRLTPAARKIIGGDVTISARQGYYH
jgi:hypothetical protein